MTIESVIFARLSGFAGLFALVDNRIYPSVGPQNVTVPFITYERISGVRTPGFGTNIGIIDARYQFDVIAESKTSVAAIKLQAIAAIDRWSDENSDPAIDAAFVENDFERYEDEMDLHRGVFDAIIHYRE